MTNTLLSIFLFLSVSINILFFWYIRNLLQYLKTTNEETKEVLIKISDFSEHLTTVYNRDIFYGDATLEALLLHTQEMSEEMEAFVKTNNNIMLETEDA
tara:strand:- start:2911 stop:3207 length:297 start_codon:yes stop_codon:yes gene_type:complete